MQKSKSQVQRLDETMEGMTNNFMQQKRLYLFPFDGGNYIKGLQAKKVAYLLTQ